MNATRIALVALLFLVSLTFLARPERSVAQTTGTTYYVAQSATASDANPGSMDAPLKTINAGIARAVAGDTIVVSSGIYAEVVTIATNDGTVSQPITLRANGNVTIQPTSGKPLVIARSYWIVSGFSITPNGRNVPGVVFQAPAQNSILRDSHVYNGLYHGVVLDDGSTDNQVLNNEIDHFGVSSSSSDAHGIAIHESHNNLISGNTIHDNMGDSVQVFSIDTQSLYGHTANNNRIVNNYMHDDRENAVDIKSSIGTVVQGNRMSGYRPSTTSDGMAIEIHYNSQNVLIANNEISDSNWGIEISRGAKNGIPYPAAPQGVIIRNNYIHNIVLVNNGNSGDGAGIVVRESSNVLVWNNTLRDAAGTCLVLTWSGTSRPSTVQLKNNSTGACGVADLFLKDTTPTSLQLDYNHYDQQFGGRLKIGSTVYTLANWTTRTSFDQHSMIASPALAEGGQLPDDSPLIDRGVDVGLFFCGTAPDIGAFESGCTTIATTTPAPSDTSVPIVTDTPVSSATPSAITTSSATSTLTTLPATATRTATRTSTASRTASSTATAKAATSTRTPTKTRTTTPVETSTATRTTSSTATAKAATSTRTPTKTRTATSTRTAVP